MLIHKQTMGVLDTFWTGENHLDTKSGLQVPVEREYTFRTAPELSPEEWWEVSRGSKLGKKLRMYYPWVTPVVDEDSRALRSCRRPPRVRSRLLERAL